MPHAVRARTRSEEKAQNEELPQYPILPNLSTAQINCSFIWHTYIDKFPNNTSGKVEKTRAITLKLRMDAVPKSRCAINNEGCEPAINMSMHSWRHSAA